jgi:TctA family transporter
LQIVVAVAKATGSGVIVGHVPSAKTSTIRTGAAKRYGRRQAERGQSVDDFGKGPVEYLVSR